MLKITTNIMPFNIFIEYLRSTILLFSHISFIYFASINLFNPLGINTHKSKINGANEIIGNRIVTVGLLNANQIHPREVFVDAISNRAASVILAHNHPSGVLKPSPDDIAATRQLVKAGKILGIEVLDHIIITKKGYLSLKQKGFM